MSTALNSNKNIWSLDTYDGGFYIGRLPRGEGIGAAVWTYIWGKYESHPDPHRYKIQLYRWEGNEFVLSKSLITKNKYRGYDLALKAYGFFMRDMSLDFSNINAVR